MTFRHTQNHQNHPNQKSRFGRIPWVMFFLYMFSAFPICNVFKTRLSEQGTDTTFNGAVIFIMLTLSILALLAAFALRHFIRTSVKTGRLKTLRLADGALLRSSSIGLWILLLFSTNFGVVVHFGQPVVHLLLWLAQIALMILSCPPILYRGLAKAA